MNDGKTRVMVFGTFDVLHPGHENFFQQARALASNPYLIVSVARDVNVAKIKGEGPLHDEQQRLSLVKSSSLVDMALLGAIGDHIPHIVDVCPEIIALGYDQNNYIDGLQEDLEKQGLKVKIIRLEPHMPEKYKSSIIKNNAKDL